jgi:hypothetical protein
MRRGILITLTAAVVLWGGAIAILSRGSISTAPPRSLERKIQDIAPGYKLEVLSEMPEDITALIAVPSGPEFNLPGKVFVGTSPVGAVYAFNVMTPNTYTPIGEGLGDYIRYGICDVTSMAIKDVDRDGTPELLATTSQIVPRGRPRLYVWSLANPIALRCMTRPDIRSSWSHGFGFLEMTGAPSLSTYVTYCGYGEVVEYQLKSSTSASGFAEETLGWKQVAQLPVSGEWLESADVDHDGQTEICVATGFAPTRAAIHIYAGDRPGTDLRLEQVIDEAGRFGNVRFLVGDTRGDGGRDIVAWWCQGLGGGESEIVRYRLGPGCVRERTVLGQGTSELFWPKDGQMAVMDLDGNGHPEIWFANTAGGLWRCEASPRPAMVRIAQIKGEFGPITPAPATPTAPACLLVALGRSILRLTDDRSPVPVYPKFRPTIAVD